MCSIFVDNDVFPLPLIPLHGHSRPERAGGLLVGTGGTDADKRLKERRRVLVIQVVPDPRRQLEGERL